MLIRDLERSLRRAGYLRGGATARELTPRAIRRIGAPALAPVYGALRKGRPGSHDTVQRGVALPRPDETRPFEFGDALDVDVVRTLLNGVRRARPGRRPARRSARRSSSRSRTSRCASATTARRPRRCCCST